MAANWQEILVPPDLAASEAEARTMVRCDCGRLALYTLAQLRDAGWQHALTPWGWRFRCPHCGEAAPAGGSLTDNLTTGSGDD
jgi:hypothetical protein